MMRQKKDLGQINPRFKKPAASISGNKRTNFNQRTLQRLFCSWRFGLLDQQHLEALLGGYPRSGHRELELTKAGLIYHPEAQVPLRAICTNISWITALSNKGADILASKGGGLLGSFGTGFRIDPTQHKERYRRHRAFNAILHDLNRSDYLVELDRSVSNSDGLLIRHQDQLFAKPYTETISFPSMVEWKKELRPIVIEPDGLFSLTFPNLPEGRQEKFFALELDQDTESNVRYKNFWNQKSVLKTMIAYAEAHKRGIIDDKLKLPNLRTIFVTTTDRHIDNILKDAGQLFITKGYAPNAILFVSREQLEKSDPLSVQYKNAAGNSVVLGEANPLEVHKGT